MDTSGIFLSTEAVKALPQSARAAIWSLVTGAEARESSLPDQQPLPQTAASEDTDALTALSARQAQRFLKGLSPKSVALLRVVAEDPEGRPLWSQLMKKGGYAKWQDLRGFLAGLTKRVRTTTSDEGALFWAVSDGTEVQDEVNGEWTDDRLFVHPQTLQALRQSFGLVH